MLVSIFVAALLVASAPLPDQADGTKAAAIVPFVGDEVAAVLYIDLTKADAQTLARQVVGNLADEADVRGAIAAIDDTVGALKKAGARAVFALFDPADMPGLPVLIVPLLDGSDATAISRVLSGNEAKSPLRLPASETMSGAVLAGTPAALARIRSAPRGTRSEVAAALAAGGNAAAMQAVIIPSTTQRRAIEESVSTLPAVLGGAPITTITRDARWVSLAMVLEPKPALRAVVQAKDADAAKAIQSLVLRSLDVVAQTSKHNPATAAMGEALGAVKPEVSGDRVVFAAEPEQAAELIATPFRQVREGARRTQCTNNLKQILLAMHNYHSKHSNFPPAYSSSADGKPLLSWRVHILPFLDQQQALYNEFHLDEPWDSPHNKTLISRMPAVYTCPSGSQALAREGKTSYLVPRGPATAFPGAKGVSLREITDGTSNTIAVVDASDELATTWTKPDDWEVAPDFKTQGLFGHHPRGTDFAFADGSVRFLKATVTAKLLEALTTGSGHEVISADDY
jgi:prepilin-type processing-associated H-X9-DG protein